MRRVAVLAALLLSGCSAAPSDSVMKQWAEVVKQFGDDKASWCFYDSVQGWGATITHSYFRVGEGQALDCQNHNLKSQPPANAGGAVITPGGDVMIRAQPRILKQDPPTFREVVPAPPVPTPPVRPQSAPGAQWRGWGVLEVAAGMWR